VYNCGLEYIDEKSTVPVCANLEENCQKPLCKKTYKNNYFACEDPLVVSYVIGACDVDQGNENENENEEEFFNEEGGESSYSEQELIYLEQEIIYDGVDAWILLPNP